MDIGALRSAAGAFEAHLEAIRAANPPRGFTWYGYDSMANIGVLDQLLEGDDRFLFSRTTRPILDVGAADGAVAFFLESVGYQVEVIDLPATNWNGLRGIRTLKELLHSNVVVREIDIDGPFDAPRGYGLVLFLGILYHLKNPFFALERFSHSAPYLLLSTRVARYSPAGTTPLDDISVAYLLGPDECNHDATNWWIFSRPGLRKLVDRAGWDIACELSLGDTQSSDPVRPDRDERVFMLLRSRQSGV